MSNSNPYKKCIIKKVCMICAQHFSVAEYNEVEIGMFWPRVLMCTIVNEI